MALRNEAVNAGRNSAEKINEWENQLEMDYMPFYFHDLRTNEILAFHAFLENVSEDFQVEYNSQEFYGRMDKIHVYKHTSRTVSVDFKIVATSPDDHDRMWYKINRLAMMIYPQWTRGREVSVEDSTSGGPPLKFIQPFSQIPGATPVIRLRLGDMFKSNYSKMAVARLFGATTYEQYNVNNSAPAPKTAAIIEAPAPTLSPNANAQRLQRVRSLSAEESFFANSGNELLTPGRSKVVLKASEIARFLRNYNHRSNHYSPNSRVEALYQERTNQGVRLLFQTISLLDRHGNPSLYRLRRSSSGSDIIPYALINNSLDREQTIFYLDEELGSPSAGSTTGTPTDPAAGGAAAPAASPAAAGAAPAAGTSTNTANAQRNAAARTINASNFYDEDRNPILKSFKSTSGRGLAGVITSFKVDYGEAKGKWGTEKTAQLRAPMFVTVQIQMAVIHDIPLGLDANGIMNAPIWPVGNSSNFFTNNSAINAGVRQVAAGTDATVSNDQQDGSSPLDYFDPGSKPYTIAKSIRNNGEDV
jgi:hypothetical protein